MELEIEGHGCSGGWARQLPTKRYYNKFIKLIINKEITTYHIFMLLLILSLFHGIFLIYKWTLKNELIILGLLLFYFILEDFCWFLFNKKIGIKKFKPGKISWHRRWFLNFIPVSYVIGGIIGTLLLILGGR
jgi:hypothetical protein